MREGGCVLLVFVAFAIIVFLIAAQMTGGGVVIQRAPLPPSSDWRSLWKTMGICKSQVAQDIFAAYVNGGSADLFWLEFGAGCPVDGSNTYVLERALDWRGLSVDYDVDNERRAEYTQLRPRTVLYVGDATHMDVHKELKSAQAPSSIAYLQINLEACAEKGATTMALLDLLIEQRIFEDWTFNAITFEHDNYLCGSDVRERSREKFAGLGYVMVAQDVLEYTGEGAFVHEDWYVHPNVYWKEEGLLEDIKLCAHEMRKEYIAAGGGG
jgi:hypothetical protein